MKTQWLPSPKGRTPELDALRGIAAVVVVFYHYFSRDAEWLWGWGWSAVDLFFVLSGFLITGIILRDGNKPGFLRTFYIRRGLRIWPIYYLTIFFLCLWARPPGGTLPYFLTYLQNVPRYWGVEPPKWIPFDHTWSLAVEEQFYLLWPPLVLLAGRRWVAPMGMGVIIASNLGRATGFSRALLLTRADGLAFGALLALLLSDPDRQRGRRRTVMFTIAASVCAGVILIFFPSLEGVLSDRGRHGHVVEQLTAVFSSTAIVGTAVLLSGGRVLAPLRFRPLVSLGVISYGVYLYHIPVWNVIYAIERRVGFSDFVGHSIAVVVTLAVAALSWRFIESPLLRLKDRFSYCPCPLASDGLSAGGGTYDQTVVDSPTTVSSSSGSASLRK